MPETSKVVHWVIVRTTNRQRERIRTLADERLRGSQRSAFLDWFDLDHSVAARHRVDTAMPAVAWRLVDSILFDHCFDARGFRTRDVRNVDLNAMKAVRRALNARESHPALYGVGAVGQVAELIPAWKFLAPDDDGRIYSPYPVMGSQFTILAPEMSEVGGRQITVWVRAERAWERPLLDEREHWRFVQ